MTTIRVKPEELETVAKHVPDAEDACRCARTSLSWELPSLVMEIPGIGSAAIHELTDELFHWLQRYEEKLNEVEELLYRTAAAIRQADQTLADNMKEFGLELLGWYDLQPGVWGIRPDYWRTDIRMGPPGCGRNAVGLFKDVAILSQKQIRKLIERDSSSSDFWKNRALTWTARDNEYLIRGEIPSKFIKISPKE
ncbi:hypothetical protein SAMN05192569_101516 [Parageobacillus thermantarcticus]|uniref:Uncharacterized protein n=1 Tax=Parageobacillus thermantarcticus TaxID=186116 RepID=A0A1I0T779_9BACL|nr:hypothetical protein SAMN05192569_101516 [Parageobacillus thermantarcticus]